MQRKKEGSVGLLPTHGNPNPQGETNHCAERYLRGELVTVR